jgi:hypothetical protein
VPTLAPRLDDSAAEKEKLGAMTGGLFEMTTVVHTVDVAVKPPRSVTTRPRQKDEPAGSNKKADFETKSAPVTLLMLKMGDTPPKVLLATEAVEVDSE